MASSEGRQSYDERMMRELRFKALCVDETDDKDLLRAHATKTLYTSHPEDRCTLCAEKGRHCYGPALIEHGQGEYTRRCCYSCNLLRVKCSVTGKCTVRDNRLFHTPSQKRTRRVKSEIARDAKWMAMAQRRRKRMDTDDESSDDSFCDSDDDWHDYKPSKTSKRRRAVVDRLKRKLKAAETRRNKGKVKRVEYTLSSDSSSNDTQDDDDVPTLTVSPTSTPVGHHNASPQYQTRATTQQQGPSWATAQPQPTSLSIPEAQPSSSVASHPTATTLPLSPATVHPQPPTSIAPPQPTNSAEQDEPSGSTVQPSNVSKGKAPELAVRINNQPSGHVGSFLEVIAPFCANLNRQERLECLRGLNNMWWGDGAPRDTASAIQSGNVPRGRVGSLLQALAPFCTEVYREERLNLVNGLTDMLWDDVSQ